MTMNHPHQSANPESLLHWQAAQALLSALVSERLYALVDVGQDPQLFADIKSWGLPMVSLLEGTPEGIYDHESPRLFQVNPSQESPGLTLCQWAERLPCISWLTSRQPLDDLAAHLRSWLGAVLLEEDGSDLGEVHVRFYDPRVLPALMATLTDAQKTHLLEPLSGWGLWSRHGTWECWRAPSTSGLSALSPAVPRLSMLQSQTLEAHTQTDRVIWLLGEQHPQTPSADPLTQRLHREFLQLPPLPRFRQMFAIREQAARWGVTSDEDLTLFALVAIGVHRDFDRHPTLELQLARRRDLGTPFAALIESVPDTVWSSLQSEHPAP
jgi:hypothetical protein